jgi:hypothetical protein
MLNKAKNQITLLSLISCYFNLLSYKIINLKKQINTLTIIFNPKGQK